MAGRWDISLYTPGGLFLDTYENVDEESVWMPNDKRPGLLRFREPKTNLVIQTTLPFRIRERPREEYNGH